MNYKLINEPNKNFSAIQQVLYNRGIAEKDIQHYLNLNDTDINSPMLLGEENLKKGASFIAQAVQSNKKTLIIIDCDCDGYTAGALIINYFYHIFPTWVINNVEYFLHSGKQHGLSDCW